jgi:hypothetical protein
MRGVHHRLAVLGTTWLLASGACGAGDDAAISIVVPGSLVPVSDGDVLETTLRPQGVYGTSVDLHIEGIPVDDVPSFGVAIEDEDGETLADQRYLTTSTGVPQDDGSFVIEQLPVVFGEEAVRERVDGRSVTVIADIDSTPPASSSVELVLAIVDP